MSRITYRFRSRLVELSLFPKLKQVETLHGYKKQAERETARSTEVARHRPGQKVPGVRVGSSQELGWVIWALEWGSGDQSFIFPHPLISCEQLQLPVLT